MGQLANGLVLLAIHNFIISLVGFESGAEHSLIKPYLAAELALCACFPQGLWVSVYLDNLAGIIKHAQLGLQVSKAVG